MGFKLKNIINTGSIRFNLSKSGVGASVGIKGLTIGTGPRGHYIRLGRNGIHYSKTKKSGSIGGHSNTPGSETTEVNGKPYREDRFEEIESADTVTITDSSSSAIVEELNSRLKRRRFLPVFICLTAVCAVIPSTRILLPLALIMDFMGFFLDRRRKTCTITYDIVDEFQEKIWSFYNSFNVIMASRKKWHVEAQANIEDKKKNAGADILVKRKELKIGYGVPGLIKTNVRVPVVPVGKQTLYFFPDRVLIYGKRSVGALSYDNLEIECGREYFAEETPVPSDSEIIRHIWKYANKSGSPDRRFRGNRKLPIVVYSYIHFKSKTGLNEKILLSASNLKPEFKSGLENTVKSVTINNSDDLTRICDI